MDLLPRTKSEFSSKEYWEKFFKKRGPKAFEWYGEYNELCGILHKYIKPADRLLVVGCGNSQLSAALYDVGYHNIMNIDISETVISQMTTQNATKRPDMSFQKMDVTQLEMADGCVSVVLDKGTLDALMPDSEEATLATVSKMFAEIERVLRLGGRYMCITLAQPHLLTYTLKYFSDLGWMIRVCRVPEKESDGESDFHLPVFVLVLTKFKKMPNMKQITEVCYFDDTVERVDGVDELEKAVQVMQQYGVVRQQLANKKNVGDNISLELYSSTSPAPRYTLHIVDSTKTFSKKYAIFIVPEGRETEWLFSTPEGRIELNKSAGLERLIVVTLSREHTYTEGLEGVKVELSTKVMELAPPSLKNQQVPFLSIGEDINTRVVRHRGTSPFSGDFVIEDVDVGETSSRRLIFLNNPSIVQTEARLITDSGKKKSHGKVPDTRHLTIEYAKHIVAGLSFIHELPSLLDTNIDVLLVGLGGGSIASYLNLHFPKLSLDVVELDPEVVRIATDWFGFKESDRMKVHVGDGLKYIQNLAKDGVKKHVVILDCDGKDLSLGMTSPPKPFVQPEFLQKIHSILDPRGLLMMNFVCRNAELRVSVIDEIKSVFTSVFCRSCAEDVNEAMYALSNDRPQPLEYKDPGKLPPEISKASRVLQEKLNGPNKSKARNRDVLQLSRLLEDISLL